MKMTAFLRAAELGEALGVTGLSDGVRVLGFRSPGGFAFSSLLTIGLAWSFALTDLKLSR